MYVGNERYISIKLYFAFQQAYVDTRYLSSSLLVHFQQVKNQNNNGKMRTNSALELHGRSHKLPILFPELEARAVLVFKTQICTLHCKTFFSNEQTFRTTYKCQKLLHRKLCSFCGTTLHLTCYLNLNNRHASIF